jgi:hypothetical protein
MFVTRNPISMYCVHVNEKALAECCCTNTNICLLIQCIMSRKTRLRSSLSTYDVSCVFVDTDRDKKQTIIIDELIEWLQTTKAMNIIELTFVPCSCFLRWLGFNEKGSLWVAQTSDRLHTLKRQYAIINALGINCEIVNVEQFKEKAPLIDPHEIWV